MRPELRRVLRLVEAGFAHSRPRRTLASHDRSLADELCALGYLRAMPKRGFFPARLVVTANGSHALGTFDMTSRDFDHEVHVARKNAYTSAA
jgi:hypothetical protein